MLDLGPIMKVTPATAAAATLLPRTRGALRGIYAQLVPKGNGTRDHDNALKTALRKACTTNTPHITIAYIGPRDDIDWPNYTMLNCMANDVFLSAVVTFDRIAINKWQRAGKPVYDVMAFPDEASAMSIQAGRQAIGFTAPDPAKQTADLFYDRGDGVKSLLLRDAFTRPVHMTLGRYDTQEEADAGVASATETLLAGNEGGTLKCVITGFTH